MGQCRAVEIGHPRGADEIAAVTRCSSRPRLDGEREGTALIIRENRRQYGALTVRVVTGRRGETGIGDAWPREQDKTHERLPTGLSGRDRDPRH